MANGLSDYAITKILDYTFGAGVFTQPPSRTLHLYKADPTTGGLEVDVVVDDTAYASQVVTFGAEGAITNNRVYNNTAETFLAVIYGSGAASYIVTHWAVRDGANILASGALPTPITRLVGEPLTVAISSIYVELART
jgi:hypothetical protein